jgi:hypothetical protein
MAKWQTHVAKPDVCMCVPMYVCMYVCPSPCRNGSIATLPTHVAKPCVCMHACKYVCRQVCSCVLIYINAYMDTFLVKPQVSAPLRGPRASKPLEEEFTYIHMHACIHGYIPRSATCESGPAWSQSFQTAGGRAHILTHMHACIQMHEYIPRSATSLSTTAWSQGFQTTGARARVQQRTQLSV